MDTNSNASDVVLDVTPVSKAINPLAASSSVVQPTLRADVGAEMEAKIASLLSLGLPGINTRTLAVKALTGGLMGASNAPTKVDTSARQMARLPENGGATREPVWHKTSKPIPDGLTAEEFIRNGKTLLSFEVGQSEVMTADPFGLSGGFVDSGRFGIIRTPRFVDGVLEEGNNPDRILGYSGKRRVGKMIQPHEYGSFADTVAKAAGDGAYVESVNTWKGGAVFAIQVRIPGVSNLPGTDRKRYLAITSSYDGTRALRMGAVDTLICCGNTLSHANAEIDESGIHLKNVGDLKARLEAALPLVKGALAQAAMADSKMIALSKISVTASQFRALLSSGEINGFQRQNALEQAVALFDGEGKLGIGNEGSGFGAYQALTEYADWYSQEKFRDGTSVAEMEEARAMRAVDQGSSAVFKRAALDKLVQYFKVDFSMSSAADR
jgi:hypothetical protein